MGDSAAERPFAAQSVAAICDRGAGSRLRGTVGNDRRRVAPDFLLCLDACLCEVRGEYVVLVDAPSDACICARKRGNDIEELVPIEFLTADRWRQEQPEESMLEQVLHDVAWDRTIAFNLVGSCFDIRGNSRCVFQERVVGVFLIEVGFHLLARVWVLMPLGPL